MKSYLEFRNLYVKDSKHPNGVLIKEAPFVWSDEVVDLINGREFDFRDPILKMKWLSDYLELDWSEYKDKNLKPIISYLSRCMQWAQQNHLTSIERKNLIKREFENFKFSVRYPFEPLSPYFQMGLEFDE